MSNPQFGSLEEVDLRRAWPHEAHNFTPWLAQHLDQLGKQIGIPLELEGSEVSVENFAADILAKNPQDNTLVLIENQLENSDHSHLGQIMTYLAGLDAKVIIWIAKAFNEAHLSALRWLNEHTDDSFSFFAIEVKAVRIADSPIAPVFEVVTRPNHWERQLQTVAHEKRSSSELMQFRRAFWAHYTNRHPKLAQDMMSGANSNRWREIEHLGLAISSYLAKGSVGVAIRSGTGIPSEDAYNILLPYAAELKEKTEREMGNSGGTYFFGSVYPADTSDQSRWDELVDWLYKTTEAYDQALLAIGD